MPSNVIVCPKCKKSDKITATYTCQTEDQEYSQGPTPMGLPYSQPCPGGCGATLQATNIRCVRCNRPINGGTVIGV